MQLKEIVFVVDDRRIIKTKIKGIQDILEKDSDGKDIEVRYYLVDMGQSARYNDKHDEEWISETNKSDGTKNIFKTLEEAQDFIKKKITAEVLSEIDKITLVDVSGGK